MSEMEFEDIMEAIDIDGDDLLTVYLLTVLTVHIIIHIMIEVKDTDSV